MAHVAEGGGLQQHSVGDTYPFMVVGTQHRYEGGYLTTRNTRYYVLNCVTGEKFYWAMPEDEHGATWTTIRDAEMVAAHLKSGYQSMCVRRVA